MKSRGTILLLALLAGCMGQSGRHILSDASREQYAKSECAKWIALPPTADHITVLGFFGFDTNYRFLKCTVGQPEAVLTNLISQSLATQPRKTNDTFILVENANITMDGMQSAFGGFPGAVPAWWRTDLSRFDRQAFCAGQSTNNYGYGYIYLFDAQKERTEILPVESAVEYCRRDEGTIAERISNHASHCTVNAGGFTSSEG